MNECLWLFVFGWWVCESLVCPFPSLPFLSPLACPFLSVFSVFSLFSHLTTALFLPLSPSRSLSLPLSLSQSLKPKADTKRCSLITNVAIENG